MFNLNLGEHPAKVVTIVIVNQILTAILRLEMHHESYTPSSNIVMGSISVVTGHTKYFNSGM